MTSPELALRLGAAPADLAILDAHRITSGAGGIGCGCGWAFTIEQLCRREETRSFWVVIAEHLESELEKGRTG